MKIVSALCVALLMAGCAASSTSIPSNARLLDDFIYTAFGNARKNIYKVEDNKACIRTLGDPDPSQNTLVSEAMSAYSLNGLLKFERGECSLGTNLAIIFIPIDVNLKGPESIWRYAIEELNRAYPGGQVPDQVSRLYYSKISQRYHTSSPDHYWTNQICNFGPSFRSEGNLVTVITISNSFRYMRRCIFEETLQSLGLPFDSPKYWPSLMNSNEVVGVRYSEISDYDLLYLRILYDSRITNTMNSQQVREAAKTILAEIRPDETRPPERSNLNRTFSSAPQIHMGK